MVLDGAVSYRQVGRNTSMGRVVNSSAAGKSRPRMNRSAASIPSRFETTLHQGRTERNGFGNRAFRFSGVAADKASAPGPGSYHRPATLERDAQMCGSVSRRGMGTGFVSKAKRFHGAEVGLLNAATEPGPGAYQPEKPPERVAFSAAGNTSNFAQPRRYRDEVEVPSATDLTPGPGEYLMAKRDAAKPAAHLATSMRSSFVSGTRRGFAPPTDGPAPDRYHLPGGVGVALPGQSGGQHTRLPMATFRSTSAKVTKELFYPEETAFGKLPGPGAYNTQQAALAARTDLVGLAQPSSTFSNTGQNRFGRPYAPKVVEASTPGPGWYGSEKERPRGIASSSFFMSATMRGTGGGASPAKKPPGPAYYTPANTMKKSFLLNPASRWV